MILKSGALPLSYGDILLIDARANLMSIAQNICSFGHDYSCSLACLLTRSLTKNRRKRERRDLVIAWIFRRDGSGSGPGTGADAVVELHSAFPQGTCSARPRIFAGTTLLVAPNFAKYVECLDADGMIAAITALNVAESK